MLQLHNKRNVAHEIYEIYVSIQLMFLISKKKRKKKILGDATTC